MEQPTLFLLCDYGIGDPAFTEVILKLRSLIPQSFIYPQSIPAFSTLCTGLWLYQIGLEAPNNIYIFSNTAPRREDKKAQKNNNGEKLMYAQLDNGRELLAINSGYAFSFLKPHIQAFHYANVANEGSQFRSRDIYPYAVAKLVAKDTSVIGEKASLDGIPSVPSSLIASIDGYGNIKTTIRQSSLSLENGTRMEVTINNIKKTALYSDGVFNCEEGQLVFAPGSSGFKDRFMELFVRGQSAKQLFGEPHVEAQVAITGV